MRTIFWEVQYLSPPKTLRYCKKCGAKTEFASSDLFRVNAQQKSLDIWLIYRCIHCKTTWNHTIYSRIDTKSLPHDLLEKFMNNDPQLARQYAMDTALLTRNGAEIQAPRHQILGEPVDFTEVLRLNITDKHSSKLRLAKILREKLCLSGKAFDQLVSDGVIRMENSADIHKCKLQGEAAVLIRPDADCSQGALCVGGREHA